MEYNKQVMNLIVGLGNPGKEYEHTYHNVGRMALEHWLAQTDADATFRRHGDYFEYARSGDIVFVRPLTFMNESGLAVREAAKHFTIKPEDIVVLHDDSDIPPGEYKISFGGGAAGHKGVQSVIDHLHTEDFSRGRIGIRDPQEQTRKKAGDFVLDAVTPTDRNMLAGVFAEIEASALRA